MALALSPAHAKRPKEARGTLSGVRGARSADFDGSRGLLQVTASTISTAALPSHCFAVIHVGPGIHLASLLMAHTPLYVCETPTTDGCRCPSDILPRRCLGGERRTVAQ